MNCEGLRHLLLMWQEEQDSPAVADAVLQRGVGAAAGHAGALLVGPLVAVLLPVGQAAEPPAQRAAQVFLPLRG